MTMGQPAAIDTRNGWLYMWHSEAKKDVKVGWASFHHDNHNTGNYEEALEVGSRDVGSSGCAFGRSRSLGGCFALLVLAVLALQRRRRHA